MTARVQRGTDSEYDNYAKAFGAAAQEAVNNKQTPIQRTVAVVTRLGRAVAGLTKH